MNKILSGTGFFLFAVGRVLFWITFVFVVSRLDCGAWLMLAITGAIFNLVGLIVAAAGTIHGETDRRLKRIERTLEITRPN